jgi:hypothetical protein
MNKTLPAKLSLAVLAIPFLTVPNALSQVGGNYALTKPNDRFVHRARCQEQSIHAAFVPRDLTEEDLGSRGKIRDASALLWYPAETDVSIRPGWFYHETQDDEVSSTEQLVYLWEPDGDADDAANPLPDPTSPRSCAHAPFIRERCCGIT